MIQLVNNVTGISAENTIQPKIKTIIYQDTLYHRTIYKQNDTRTIFIQVEPEAICSIETQFLKDLNQYDFILTFNKLILEQCPNAYKYLYGTTFILPTDYQTIDIDAKQFLLTNLTSDKLMAYGHEFRHTVYYKQEFINTIPTRFYISNDSKKLPIIQENPRLGAARHLKIDLFKDAQFSLIIENSRQDNYFTEKLCDCLITKTIPVYYGCPNISEFFDTTGWILLEDESFENFISKIEVLTPNYYRNYLETIEKNFETVKQYIDIQENINKGLRSIPDY
jgi:hypothetical protein